MGIPEPFNSTPSADPASVTAEETPYGVRIDSGGHALRGDEPVSHGGDTGPTPFGLLLSGLGACTAITLRMYAERKQWPLTGVDVELSYLVPDRSTRWINRTITLHGPVDDEQRAKLAEIAEKTPSPGRCAPEPRSAPPSRRTEHGCLRGTATAARHTVTAPPGARTMTGQAPDAPNVVLPAQPPSAFAIYAFRRARSTDPRAPSALPAALAAGGIAVLTVDLGSASSSATPSAEDGDLAALGRAAEALRSEHREPSLLIGHAAAGPAVLAAAGALPGVRAVVTLASQAPRARLSGNVPLLILHAPDDPIVPVREAGRVFAARHPRSFIALDGVDHDVSEPRHAHRVAALIGAWVEPYLPHHARAAPLEPPGGVVVTDAGTGRYTQRITAGRHLLTADEPVSIGGADAGPNPYELLLAALGACKSMTMRMYADRQGLPLHRTTVRLHHDRVHAKDCEECEQQAGMLSRIRSEIDIEGPLGDQDRRRLLEIADRCPVHRTLNSEIIFEATEA